jgi:branched-chain amino acid aminotransferase
MFVICSPVGPYYKNGFKPVRLLATSNFIRAAPGGTGGYKLGANYAPGVVPQVLAAKEGYDQNLWLLGDEHFLTEVPDRFAQRVTVGAEHCSHRSGP